MKLHVYGMRSRGYAPGCQPKGVIAWRDCEENECYHSEIAYVNKLLQKEERQYELDYLGERAVNEE